MIKFQEMVPEVYTSESRDFQLFCRLYDSVFNGVKFNTEDITQILSAKSCNNKLLQLLQTKLGFFTTTRITDEALRYILDAFPMMLKNKGTMLGVYQAIYVFLRINKMSSDAVVSVQNYPKYQINIGINSSITNTEILTAMLDYIIPTGYIIHYFFYTKQQKSSLFKYIETIKKIFIKHSDNSQVRNFEDSLDDYGDITDEDELDVLNAVDTIAIIGYDDYASEE